jgi:hypothetical protein
MRSFDTWDEVRDFATAGGILYYQAPLDREPTRVSVVAIYLNGKMRLRAGDLRWTVDEGHLPRFRRNDGQPTVDWNGERWGKVGEYTFVVEVKVGGTWERVRPTGGPVYTFATEADAESFIRRYYPDHRHRGMVRTAHAVVEGGKEHV